MNRLALSSRPEPSGLVTVISPRSSLTVTQLWEGGPEAGREGGSASAAWLFSVLMSRLLTICACRVSRPRSWDECEQRHGHTLCKQNDWEGVGGNKSGEAWAGTCALALPCCYVRAIHGFEYVLGRLPMLGTSTCDAPQHTQTHREHTPGQVSYMYGTKDVFLAMPQVAGFPYSLGG